MTAPMPETMSPREKVFVSASCSGETCHCGGPAVRKVGEEIPHDDPNPHRQNHTAYVCARHYAELMGPSGARSVGYADLASSGDHAELADYCRTLVDPGDLIVGPNMMRHALEQSADAIEALIAGVAALRERLETARIAREAHNRQYAEAERKLADAHELLSEWLAQSCDDDQIPKLQGRTRTFLSSKEAERG